MECWLKFQHDFLEPGYRGCYDVSGIANELQSSNESHVESASECVTICRSQGRHFSLINRNSCFCLPDDKLEELINFEPDEGKCDVPCTSPENELCGGPEMWFSCYDGN